MAISSWMIWGRGLRTSRSQRSRQGSEGNCVELDLSRGLKENIKEVLTNLCQTVGVPSTKKLAYLNAIVKLIAGNDAPDYGYSMDQLFCCLRVGLIHEATQVRAAALRSVRYMLKREQDVVAINKLQYPYFVARSMDVNLRNEMERVQALRLVRRILVLAPKHFSPVLVRSLISLTNGGIQEKDRAFRVFLATLCELGVLNANLLINCGGVGTLAKAAMTGQSPTIVESVVGVLLKLLNNPETRNSVSFLCFAAPYCELHSSSMERTKEDREQKFAASKFALLSILRSYAGVIHFCHPNDNSGLKAIADILYVDQLEVRGAVLELLYELLDLPLPTWTDEPDVALAAVDPCRFRESWKLSEGFVALEGKFILPSLSSHCPNITEIHLALLVYVLLECGLHRALAETIVTSDTFISVRAAVLLGALLHLAHSLLPSEVCDLTPPLPNLLEHASAGKHQALAAVTILSRMHTMMRRRPAPASLFLDRILQAGTWLRPTLPRRQRRSSKNWLRREPFTTQLLKDAQVLSSKDALAWDWPVVRSILRCREDTLRMLHDSDHRLFIKRLVRYFKPSSNAYSRVELGTNGTVAREATLAGCDLLNCLLEVHEPEGTKLLHELIGDIADQITAIRASQSAHECLFSPRHMSTTCCQKYFLFLGQLSHSAKGTVILKGFNLLEKLQDLALATNHDCYVKLIVSSLDYTREGPNRKVMTKIITESTLESTRLYATQFLRLILRAKMSDAYRWAITLLSGRLSDNSKIVSLTALEVLHEACEDPEYLEALLQHGSQFGDWVKWLQHLGDKGYLLKIRLYSLRQGFSVLPTPAEELERWIKPDGFAERYVCIVEGEIHDALTRRQRNERGHYHRRCTNVSMVPRNVFLPPHLIGQMTQHDLGQQLLLRRNVVQRFARVIQRFRMEFGGKDSESNSRCTKATRPMAPDDSCIMSEESGTEDTTETNRLETIVDSEATDAPDMPTPQKTASLIEIRRKASLDDSRRTTPERSWRGEPEHREEQSTGLNGRVLKVKSALWALGHAGTSAVGVEQLHHLGIVETILSVAESCPYYAVRATASYALSLMATTRAGADILTALHWPCVRHRRGDPWPVVPPTPSYPVPSPIPIQRHHRSLSDGKPELTEPTARRTRNRSESAATDLEARRYVLPERGETPSPVSSIHRLSQQDAEGYARLRSLQRHRRPSYSQSSLEMYSSNGRLSLQSLSEYDSSRSWITDPILTPTPPPPEEESDNLFYMGICLPRRLASIFPDPPQMVPLTFTDDSSKADVDTTEVDEESGSECDVSMEHSRLCLICSRTKAVGKEKDIDPKIRKEILKHTLRLANPVWYRHSRQALLRLRQRYPALFQDVCLFSDVASRLGNGTYRMPARRFLQELFLDSSFSELYDEPAIILEFNNGGISPTRSSATIKSDGNSRVSVTVPESKVNGRLSTVEIQAAKLDMVKEEGAGEPRATIQQTKTQELRIPERRSDEKIIAEILNPEERIRLSKSSDRLLKVSGTNTAISLD